MANSVANSKNKKAKDKSVYFYIIVTIAALYAVVVSACILQLFRLQAQDRRMQQNEIISNSNIQSADEQKIHSLEQRVQALERAQSSND